MYTIIKKINKFKKKKENTHVNSANRLYRKIPRFKPWAYITS